MLSGNDMTIQRAIVIANLAFIALAAYFSAGLFYQIIGIQLQPIEPAVAEKSTPFGNKRITQKPYGAYQPILQRDLFKTQKEPVAPIKKSDLDLENLEETKLKLKLWGTVTGDKTESYAVIENTQSRMQNLYRIGDSIENATLKRIFKSKVVLSVNGKDEMLAMEEIKQGGSRSRVVAGGSRVPRQTDSRGIRRQRVSLRRNMINKAIEDVSKLMTQVKITPKIGEDGRQEGLAMSNIKPNSIFRRMGLRNGDVLKSVDGHIIESVDDALRIYDSLKSADKVSVQIMRRGAERTIEYNIR
jgi:general secretion pathway protein C